MLLLVEPALVQVWLLAVGVVVVVALEVFGISVGFG